jgi:hypothetical protein
MKKYTKIGLMFFIAIAILSCFGYVILCSFNNEWVREFRHTGYKDDQIVTGETLIRTMWEPRESTNTVVSVKTLASHEYVNYLYSGYAISDANDKDYIDRNAHFKLHFKLNILGIVTKLTAEQQKE